MKEPSGGCDVSVVIPAYRARSFIDHAIQSALSQSDVLVEVIVVDDASPDDTADYVNEQYGSAQNVRAIRMAVNSGPAAARNMGLREARSSWIAVLDADDSFEEGRLARLLHRAEAASADIIADNVRYYNAPTNSLSDPMVRSFTADTQISLRDFIAGARPGTGEMDFGLFKPMYRARFLRDTGLSYPENIRHGEDFAFYVNLLAAGAKFIVIPEAGYHWALRTSGNSQTHEDYRSQSRHALAMAKLPQIAPDKDLSRLLWERSRALLDLHHQKRLIRAKQARRIDLFAIRSISHPIIAGRMLGGILRRRLLR